MADKERNALIPLPAGGLENIGSGPKSILSGMVSDALALVRAREKSLAAARFRIGEYEFRDPDYRQILIWAKALGIESEAFINCLEDSFKNIYSDYVAAIKVEDGSIVSLVWDFDIFPISSFEWVEGLNIKKINFDGWAPLTKISLCLPLLNQLDCSGIGLTELDLSNVPRLIKLFCCANELVELDLSNVPKLTELGCDDNQLVKLNLSTASALTWLGCNGNQLIELDLSAVPKLTGLSCYNNQLVELDLSAVPALTWLWCHNNQLVELDLSMVPALTDLMCDDNQLVELDIRGLGQLSSIHRDPSVTLKKLPTQDF